MKSNSRFLKTAVATGLIVVTGAAALGVTSFASAQVADQPSAVVVAVDDTATDTSTPSTDGTYQHKGEHMGGRKGGPGKFNSEGLTSVLKLTAEELKTELQSGKSLAAIAEAQNVDIADVKAQLTKDFKAHLAEEVTAGKHTQAEADAKLEQFTARLDDMVNRVRPAGGPMGGRKGGPGKFNSEGLTSVLKLTAEELKTELQSGKSLAAIAEAQNVDIADVKAQLTKDFKAHLAEEVTAGKHTQAEADAKLEQFTARLDDMVNRVRPAGPGMGRGMGGHKGGMRGGHGHNHMNEAPTAQSDAQGTNTGFSA